MSAAPSQLVEINRELIEKFSSHHAISVVPVKGDPPERYEISYNIKGLSKHGGGEVAEATGHVVELAIPFGFPHFPPSCKPKTDIFHPDFDPAAICLGDFWQQDCSLTELVIYIGRLINGEFYSKTNAFNEEACTWYQEHAETFPLAEVIWHEESSADVHSAAVGSVVDILEESDLSSDFDFLAIEEDREEERISPAASSSVEPSPGFDPDLLQFLDRQRRFFTLRDRIKVLDADQLPADILALRQKAEKNILKAENLLRESQQAERNGDLRQALASLAGITEYVTDFPDLEEHTLRLRSSLAEQEEEKQVQLPNLEALTEGNDSAKPAAKKSKNRPIATSSPVPMPLDTKKLVGTLLVGCFVVLAASGGYLLWLNKAKLDAAQAAFTECTSLLDKSQFESAKQSCEEAQTRSNGISLIFKNQARQLQSQISEILQSARMNQGLKGMILIDGKYLSKQDAETIEVFWKLHKEGEEFFLQEKWQQVIDRYAKILALSNISRFIPGATLADVKTKHDIARFRQIYDTALQFDKDGKWQEAINQLGKAEEILTLLPEADRQQYEVDLKASQARSNFEKSREQGDLFFSNSEWQKAVTAYKLALSTAESKDSSTESIETVQRNIKRAELYDLIDKGIKAFGIGAWDEAIGDYRQAEELLASHQANMNVNDADKSIKKLSRIVLQALIYRERQTAAAFLKKKEYLAARSCYKQLIEHIDKSLFAEDKEFAEARKELSATIQSLDEKIFISEKSRYLENEYRSLFASYYPTAVVENLSKPIITFTKDVGDKAIFKMQCTETGGGRPLALVMYYAYDSKNGQWTLHSEQ